MLSPSPLLHIQNLWLIIFLWKTSLTKVLTVETVIYLAEAIVNIKQNFLFSFYPSYSLFQTNYPPDLSIDHQPNNTSE